MSTKLSIIIVNWNTLDLLRQCLRSVIGALGELLSEIIVVDNASSDGSPEMVNKEFPSVRLVENTSNLGFAKANNQGLSIAHGEYALLLNSDTIIEDCRLFTEWIAFMDQHPEAGASGCRLVFPCGAYQVGDAGFQPSLLTAVNFSMFLSKLFPRYCRGLFLQDECPGLPLDVDWVSGADFLVRKSILSQTGMLDESIFMYAEDIEWGCRIRKYGYRIYYLPHLQIVHLQGASSVKDRTLNSYSVTWLRNIRNLYLHLEPGASVSLFDAVLFLGYVLRTGLYFGLYLKTGEARYERRAQQMFQYAAFFIKRDLLGGP
ncbi:MAG TPA: glycosyltransferase family 2 protein [Thermodesulfobacteriota bacterium]|jgi:GT2 family glycosyltransferase|nr:glycosyltransferase family 2 protein [Thermodesulfobacteriota bacterium]